MLSGFAFTILWPEVKTPGLVIRKNADSGVNDAIRPRVDGCSLGFGGVGECLAREREQQSVQVQICRDAETFDLALRSIRCGAAQFICEERLSVRIS